MLLINFDEGNVIRQNAKKKDICSAPNISTWYMISIVTMAEKRRFTTQMIARNMQKI